MGLPRLIGYEALRLKRLLLVGIVRTKKPGTMAGFSCGFSREKTASGKSPYQKAADTRAYQKAPLKPKGEVNAYLTRKNCSVP